ncbi:MAG: 4-hydroxy-3-methylbut-2-enyl diphosphate reductase [Bacteroidales bacterium]|nr:4-hydroxy-3-methylbut-2-enyl diphosphate reductase [Bacteroidales bacterium]
MPREVVIDENSGFCFGVINAIRTAEEHLRKHPFLYCLGDIVHNSEEVRRLTSMGLRIITNEQLHDLRDTTVLIRAHGEPPETYRLAEKNRIRLIDATCPVVLRLQKRIHDEYHTGGNKQILIFGKKGHAEVVGLLGQTDNTGLVISSPEDIERIDFSRPSKLYSQTTQSLERYNELIGLIRARYETAGHTEWFSYEDTICRKVASRARQIADFATRHNVILFISGEKSSNGMYLYNICREHNPRSYLLSRTEQLREVPINDNDTVGVCGATSTPMWLMEEIAAACAK